MDALNDQLRKEETVCASLCAECFLRPLGFNVRITRWGEKKDEFIHATGWSEDAVNEE